MVAKKKDREFMYVIGVSFFIPVFLAIMDLIGRWMWLSVGGFGSEIYQTAEPRYMILFWIFAYSIIFFGALVYWLIKKDFSESVALALIPTILLQFGAEDIYYYIIGGFKYWGTEMPWINHLLGVKFINNFFHIAVTNAFSLAVSFAVGTALALIIAYLLKKIEYRSYV